MQDQDRTRRDEDEELDEVSSEAFRWKTMAELIPLMACFGLAFS
jgi:hypothetical protein